MEQAELSEYVAGLVIFYHSVGSFSVLGLLDRAFEEAGLYEVHAVAVLPLLDDNLSVCGFLGNHTIDQKLFFFCLKIVEEKTVHEVESDHYLRFFVLLSCRSQTNWFTLAGEHLIGLRADSFSHFTHHVLSFDGFANFKLLN